ncbi:MAG: hypothetical protein HY925_11745 [Elusimicrobia bacterium]|nr:hypothetical protein [Elusimicrobiota bacterium]
MKTILLSLALAFSAAQPAGPGDTFVALVTQPWTTLDPAVATDAGSYGIVANVYEPLLGFEGGNGHIRPWLASRVPTPESGLVSRDGRTYRFPIRKGVQFHLGGMLTAEDARYSLLREMLIETPGGTSSFLLRPILGVDSVLDDKGRWALDPKKVERALRVEKEELVIELAKPFPGILAIVASIPVVLPKAWAISKGDWDGRVPKIGDPPPAASSALRTETNGTGAFKLEKFSDGGAQTWLARFDDYWGPAPRLAAVYLRAEPSAAIRSALLRSGEADFAVLDRCDLMALEGAKRVVIDEGLPNYSSGDALFLTLDVDAQDNPRLGPGVSSDFFRDEKVRKAFAHAFDGEEYLRQALGGKGQRAGGPIPPTLAERSRPNPFPFDPEKAKALLREAKGGKLWVNGFRLTVTYRRGSLRGQVASELLQRGVQALNPAFKIDLEALAPADFDRESQAHRLAVFPRSLAPDYPDAHAVAFDFFHSKGFGAKAQRLADGELDRLEEAAAGEADPFKRGEKYRALEALAASRAYQIYTAFPEPFKARAAVLKGVKGDQSMSALGLANLLYWPSLSKD